MDHPIHQLNEAQDFPPVLLLIPEDIPLPTPDELWPEPEPLPWQHCTTCHFDEQFDTYHWSCKPFPGLTCNTCPTCSPDSDPFEENPLLLLVSNRFTSYYAPIVSYLYHWYQNSFYAYRHSDWYLLTSTQRLTLEFLVILAVCVLYHKIC